MKKDESVVVMTTLGKTWLLDLDGTLVKHNGYKIDGEDSLLPNTERLMAQIHPEDTVILLTSRGPELKEKTESFLHRHNIRYDYIVFGLPFGERILINDKKPSGLEMAFAVNLERDHACGLEFVRDSEM